MSYGETEGEDKKPNSLRLSGSWLIFSKFTSRASVFIFGVILARILYPEEFGYLITVQIFTGLASQFANAGMADALIRKKEINDRDISTLFTLQLAIGVGFFLLLSACAPLMVMLFEHPIYYYLLPLASVAFLLRPFSNVAEALLHREYRYKALAVIRLGRTVAAGSASISMALYGLGVYSLVLSGLLAGLLCLPFLWYVAGWRPRLGVCRTSMSSLAPAGVKFALTNLLFYAHQQLPRFAISRSAGPAPLGLYNKAESLCEIPIEIIVSSVCAPLFRRMSQLYGATDEVRYLYRKSTQLLLFYIGPVYVMMHLLAKDFVVFVYGDRWQIAGELLQILAFTGFLRLLVQPAATVLSSQRLLNKSIRIEVELIALLLAYLLLVWDSSVLQLAWAMVLLYSYRVFRVNMEAWRKLQISGTHWFKHQAPFLVFNLLTLAAGWLLMKGLTQAGLLVASWQIVLVGGLLLPISALALSYLFPIDSFRTERDKLLNRIVSFTGKAK